MLCNTLRARSSSSLVFVAKRTRVVCHSTQSPSPNPPSAAQSPPPAAQRKPPARPSGPPVMLGPDGKPLEVVPVEKAGAEAWSGIAALDKGERDEPTNWGKIGLLVAGDLGTLLAFAAIGRAGHGWDVASIETLQTALPFALGWCLTAPVLGGYGKTAQGSDVKGAALTAAKCWAVGAPLGIAIRSMGKGYIPATSFMLITLGTTAVLMVGWRTAAAALTPKVAPSAPGSKRKDRKGDMFEMFQLIKGLTQRW